MIIGQAIFQMTAIFLLYYVGPSILNYPFDGIEIRSVVFNTFVWQQIWNQLNNRRLDNKYNIFVGVHRNWLFSVVCAIMVGCQIMIMFVGKRAFQIQPISGKDWGISLVLSALCLPWAILVRLFPDWLFERIAKFVGRPVVLVYRPVSRWTHAASRKIRGLRRKRKESERVARVAEEAERFDETGKVQDEEKGSKAQNEEK